VPIPSTWATGRRIRSMSFMEKVTRRTADIPTWPFQHAHTVAPVAGQAVPVLTLLGTSGPVIGVIQSLVEALGQ